MALIRDRRNDGFDRVVLKNRRAEKRATWKTVLLVALIVLVITCVIAMCVVAVMGIEMFSDHNNLERLENS